MPKPKTLRADLLKFGDVILSSGHAAKDIVVVLGTREGSPKRRYSHAALVLTPTIWLESTGEGTGLTYQEIVTSWESDRQRRLVDVTHYREIDVFRMPELEASAIDPTSDAFQALLQEFVGFQYPRLCELADTTKWLKQFPETKRRIMDAFNPDEVVNPGAFCHSWLLTCSRSARARDGSRKAC
jgi:hypothetical protein